MNKNSSNDNVAEDMFTILGDDILCQILSGLPVKSLLQFKLVCKRWRSLIEDPHFIQLHLSQSKTRPFLLINCYEESKIHCFSADLFESGTAVHMVTTPSRNIETSVQALKPVNGLICFVRLAKDGGAGIYNFSTREETPWIESTIIEEEERDVELYLRSRYNPGYGFGFDPTTKEHKVVCIWDIKRYTNSRRTELTRVDRVYEVLTIGQHTWRRIIHNIPLGKFFLNSIYVNNNIYWLNTSGHNHVVEDILAFDVGSEKFRVIPIPDIILADPIYTESYNLMEVDGRLTLICATWGGTMMDTFKLWMFDDKKSSTTTSINNHWIEETITMSVDCQQVWYGDVEAIPGTDLIIIKPFKPIDNHIIALYYYDRKKKTSRKVEISSAVPFPMINYDFQLLIFVDSLLPVQNQYLHKSNDQRALVWEHRSRSLNQHLHVSSVEREQESERQRRNLPPKPDSWFKKCAPSCFRSPPEN